jgi:quinohemoprotein ethanol dehydrogenase
VAWDPVLQKARWRAAFPQTWTSGVLATDAGLVFHSAGPTFAAYEAATGKRVWSVDLGANAIAPASTYEVDGEQYVALMVGYGGAGGMGGDQPRRGGRLLVFKLGGAGKPPPYPAVAVQPPLDLTAAEPSKGDADRGAAVYRQYCGTCHGGGVFLPNLSRSPAILSQDGFRAIVRDGALKDRGMAPFKRFLNLVQVEDIRAYLLWQATQAPPTEAAAPAHAQ